MSEPNFPPITDPNVAMVFMRLAQMHEDQQNYQHTSTQEMAEMREEFRSELSNVNDRMKPIEKVITRAQGGYLVLLGIGSLSAFLIAMWDKVAKLFGKT